MIQKSELAEVWTTMRVVDIANKHSMTVQSVYSLARRYGLPSRLTLLAENDGPGEGDPTPEQIKERAEEIRNSWPPGEHNRRFVGKRRVRYEMPRVATSDLFGASEAASYSRI